MNFNVSTVDDGQKALEFVESQTVDMVLMDIEMPIMDGLTATREIRGLGGVYRHLPIIAMTAADTEQDKAQGISAGMTDYLTKPLAADAMFVMAQKWLLDKAVQSASSSTSECLSSLSAMDQFDFEAALRRIRGNERLLVAMLRAFIESHGAADQELSLLLHRQDYEQAERLLHQIKGSGANLGLVGLSGIAANIEQQLKQQDYAITDETLSCFECHIQYMCQHLARLSESEENIKPALSRSIPLSRDRIIGCVKKIREYVKSDLSEAKKEIEILTDLCENTEYEDVACDIDMAFSQFDLSGLKQKLDRFLSE